MDHQLSNFEESETREYRGDDSTPQVEEKEEERRDNEDFIIYNSILSTGN